MPSSRNVKKKVSGSPTGSLISATTGCFMGMTSIALFGPAMHILKEKLQLGPVEAAWLIACPVASGSIMRVAFGAYADAVGAVKPFIALLILAACGIFGVAGMMLQLTAGEAEGPIGPISVGERLLTELVNVTNAANATAMATGPAPGTYSGLLALGVLAGFGIATFTVGVGQIAYWHPKASQGSVLGVYGGVICAAPGVWTMVLPHMLQEFGLFKTYLFWGCLVVAVAVFYGLVGRNSAYFQLRQQGMGEDEAKERAAEKHGQELFPARNATEGLRIAAGVWKTWALVCLYFSTFGGMVSLTGWLPTYWHEVHGVRPTTAGSLAALFNMSFSVVRAVSGPLSDRLGGEVALALALSTMLAGASTIVVSRDFNLDLLGEGLLALGAGVSTNAVFKLIPHEVPQAVGGAAGLVGGLGAFGGFVITPCLASFAHMYGKDGYSQGFVVFAILALANLGLTFALHCTSGEDETSSEEEETESNSELADGDMEALKP